MAKSKLTKNTKITVTLILPKLDPGQRTVEVGETGIVTKITPNDIHFQMDSDNYEFYLNNDDYECDTYFDFDVPYVNVHPASVPSINSLQWLEGPEF